MKDEIIQRTSLKILINHIKNRMFTRSQSTSLQNTYQLYKEKITLQEDRNDSHLLSGVSKADITSNKTNQNRVPPDMIH